MLLIVRHIFLIYKNSQHVTDYIYKNLKFFKSFSQIMDLVTLKTRNIRNLALQIQIWNLFLGGFNRIYLYRELRSS